MPSGAPFPETVTRQEQDWAPNFTCVPLVPEHRILAHFSQTKVLWSPRSHATSLLERKNLGIGRMGQRRKGLHELAIALYVVTLVLPWGNTLQGQKESC